MFGHRRRQRSTPAVAAIPGREFKSLPGGPRQSPGPPANDRRPMGPLCVTTKGIRRGGQSGTRPGDPGPPGGSRTKFAKLPVDRINDAAILVNLDPADRQKNHVPDWVFELCRGYDVFIRDEETGELIQVLDLRE